VLQFKSALPDALIVVCDNNSTDRTVECALAAGASVLSESRQGKGNAVRRLFSDIDADIYILVDGDCTYDASAAPELIKQMYAGNLDFINAARVSNTATAYRTGHRLGNRLLSSMVQIMFGRQFGDMLSGYKFFSRRYVKSFPSLSRGFEIETELTVHALELRMASAEYPSKYVERPEGSMSKLKTYRDGIRILGLIVNLVRRERPLVFFGVFGTLNIIIGISLAVPLVVTYFATGTVPRLPTAVLIVGLGIAGLLSFFSGLILDTITTGRQEMKRLVYLATPPLRQIKPTAGYED
jgi:glycosyltransferase involved in cell wall biosynthesis